MATTHDADATIQFRMNSTVKDGDRLILTPRSRNRLMELLASWEPLEEGLAEVEDTAPQNRDPF